MAFEEICASALNSKIGVIIDVEPFPGLESMITYACKDYVAKGRYLK